MDTKDYQKRLEDLNIQVDNTLEKLDKRSQEAQRVINIIDATPSILDDLDAEFEQQTALTKTDVAFLMLATALQCVRWVMQENVHERKYESEKYSPYERKHRLYHPSLEEIVARPVPFDTNKQSAGALEGSGSLGHRALPGHDPIVGLVIGTANIATSTLTRWDLKSFHIKTGIVNVGHGKQASMDVISDTQRNADFSKIMYYTKENLISEGKNGKILVLTALMKEIHHLKTDLYTPKSLPLPGVTMLSPQLASNLADWGLDMANVCNVLTVTKQAGYAMMINTFVAMLHGLLCTSDLEIDRKLFEVRTRKILSVSNLLASTSNVIYTAASRNIKKLDFGGLAVTLYRLLTDQKFIASVKYEYIFGSYRDMILGEDANRQSLPCNNFLV